MAEIKFYANLELIDGSPAGDPSLINHGAGSGLGFYGIGFGISVPVGQYQDSTFITDSAGTVQGSKLNNTKWADVSGVSHNSNGRLDNQEMPNYYAPLNIRFTHTEDVRVQNCKLRIFDRKDISKQASGVTTQVYEIRNPGNTESIASSLTMRGEDNHGWKEYDSTLGDAGMFDTNFSNSPGVSGTNSYPSDSGKPYLLTVDGNSHESSRHDWYVALSASPQGIGSKTDFGLYFTCEYL
jgi:hypothetical protein